MWWIKGFRYVLVRCVSVFGPFDIGIFRPAAGAGNGAIEPYRQSDGTGKWLVDSLQVEVLAGHSSTQQKNDSVWLKSI